MRARAEPSLNFDFVSKPSQARPGQAFWLEPALARASSVHSDLDSATVVGKGIIWYLYFRLFTRPGVAGAVLHTASLLVKSLSDPFPADLHNSINPKPEELGS